MNCKNCGNLIDKDANFCPYCGESISKEKSTEYNDPFKDLRIDTTYSEQYQYQKQYSNQTDKQYQNDLEIKRKSNKSLIGLIFGVLSIFISFINHASIIGIGIAIVAIVLAIIGRKESSKPLAVASIIITIFTFIITMIINILMFVASIVLTFENGYTTTIKDYLMDAFFCGYNEHYLEGYWADDSNELLYLDDEGNYYIYSDANELTDNYYYGNYELEEGWTINNQEIIFANDNYYFYQMQTMFNKAKIEGTVYNETIELIQNGFILKLNKENKQNLVLVSNDGETEIEFEKR